MKVFVHGLGQSSESWNKTISYMKDSENIFCPDLCSLLHNTEPDYNNLYGKFADYCNKFNEPIDLCGLSLGSILALNYAIEYPENVKSLILIAPQYKMPVKLLKLQNLIFRFMPKSMFKQTGFDKNSFIQLCKTMMKLDFSDCVISCPTLIICGEKDRANKKSSYELSKKLDIKLIFLKNSGHEVNIDSPKMLAKILKIFTSEKNDNKKS